MQAGKLGKKVFIFRPLFASFVLALGLSACLGVAKRNEGVNRNKRKKEKKKGHPSIVFPLFFWYTLRIEWTQRMASLSVSELAG